MWSRSSSTTAARAQLGGYFIVETDPEVAADKLYAAIQERRAAMGLSSEMVTIGRSKPKTMRI